MARATVDLFKRRGLRWLLAPVASVRLTFARRQLCFVWWSTGWVHRYRSGVLEGEFGARPPAELALETLDVFAWGYRPKEGDTVIDIGSGVGEEIATWSRLVGPTGRVIAVEASPRAYALLRANVRRWRLHNVTTLHRAVSDRPGTLFMADESANIRNRIANDGGTAVEATTLPQVFEDHGVARVGLLKMNIEGAERAALLGLGEAAAAIENLAVSCHDFMTPEFGPDAATKTDVRAWLRANGFAVAERATDPRPWVADTLYGSRTRS